MKNFFSLIKTYLSTLLLPIAYILIPFDKRRKIDTKDFFALSVNLDKQPLLTPQLIDELDVKNILIRVPLWEVDKISEYVEFCKSLSTCNIFINILQDKEHIDDRELLKKDLETIFENLSPYSFEFQIGSTINRAKWGFFSVNEYLKFFYVAHKLRDEKFQNIKLYGGGVIDFEYHFSAHTLFNTLHVKYDGYTSLLYVDRRGAPENRQMWFNLTNKISLLSSLLNLSFKSRNRLYITETNWPISNTAPYAPTSEFECVDEDSYASFMLRYYILALATQKVERVYWHQLIASGYGLIDERDGVTKRVAFDVFKTMLEFLSGSKFISLNVEDELYTFTCSKLHDTIEVMWTLKFDKAVDFDESRLFYTKTGISHHEKSILITQSPIYIISEKQ
ncbi:MAG: glycosyl hydrolase [Campylobacterota bacterium]|nr:glycosyl hydrolase [Campylobacterota bacterium]